MRKSIPKAIRQSVWEKYNGKIYEAKCFISWCTNTCEIIDFHVGHNVPVALGGDDSIENLRPICSSCNLSMGTETIDSWNNRFEMKEPEPIILTKAEFLRYEEVKKEKNKLEKEEKELKNKIVNKFNTLNGQNTLQLDDITIEKKVTNRTSYNIPKEIKDKYSFKQQVYTYKRK